MIDWIRIGDVLITSVIVATCTSIISGVVVFSIQKRIEKSRAQELELFRATIARDQARFSWAHERRAKLVVYLYRWLTQQEARVKIARQSISTGDYNVDAESVKSLMLNALRPVEKFPDIALFLSPEIPSKIEEIGRLQFDLDSLVIQIVGVARLQSTHAPFQEYVKQLNDSFAEIEGRISSLKSELEFQFREILGLSK